MNKKSIALSLLLSLALVGCKSGSDSEHAFDGIDASNNNSNNNGNGNNSGNNGDGTDNGNNVVPDAKLVELVITPAVVTYTPQINPTNATYGYTAQASYDDGSIADVTKLVEWSLVLPDIAEIKQGSGEISPLAVGQSLVSASMDGITSNDADLIIKPSYVCGHDVANPLGEEVGGGINDAADNASGQCLKIASTTDSNGNELLFTSSPSEELMNSLQEKNYVQKSGWSNENEGYTYKGIINGFATFDQLFVGIERNEDGEITEAVTSSEGGQYDRWCKDMAARSFAGQSDWRVVTKEELDTLFNSANNPTVLQWPMATKYWSDTIDPSAGTPVSTGFFDSGVGMSEQQNGLYVTCTSIK